jgi:exodeoxyribonuclease VII large subunit
LIPTRVQGEFAGEEIEAAISLANEFNQKTEEKIDVLIVGRGGGSSEDLWAFNEERVARAIRNSMIPVISAVGHEIDFTIADYASDRRAPTPSAAAEIVAESEEGLQYFIGQLRQDLFQIINYKMLHARSDWQEIALSPVFTEFPQRLKEWEYEIEDLRDKLSDALTERLKNKKNRLEILSNRLSPLKLASNVSEKKTRLALLRQKNISAMKNVCDDKDEKLKIRMASLDALSPLAVLRRGFSVTENEKGKILRSADDVKADEKVKIRLAQGKIEAKVITVEKN